MIFCDNYDLSLFISAKAFLPSLRVLKTSQDRVEMIRMVRVIREITFVLISLVNLLKLFFEVVFDNQKISNVRS